MNNSLNKIVSAKFTTEKDLAEAVKFLDSKGISKDEIKILNADNNSFKNIKINSSNKIAENALKGVVTGLIAGGVLGSLLFIGILIIPAAGLAVAGRVIGAFVGIAIGITAGSLIGGLSGMKSPKYEAVFFENTVSKNILLVTKTDNATKNEIKKKFTEIGAKNIMIR